MENKTSSNTFSSSFSLTGCIEFLLSPRNLFWVDRFRKYYHSLLQSQLELVFFGKPKVWVDRKNPNITDFSSRELCFHEKRDDGKLCREDVEMVMESLGISCFPDGEKIQERLGLDEVSVLFAEKEPSLEEVKEAFDVFDENRDGFIDARELQRVLCSLGFREGSEVEECRKMIETFDENGDEQIDFNEFVKFMENSLF
ncbi:hypothetical protein HHK36_007258 [Tetracentron sinense]|uniref:EF-hand domain-containing protein n=1 Tax=Tetracentron sinense TaxID=13715 RepID=A0A834ZJH0_TETSI|nr:hypothetical protein HHK36_007258 [Tetracentron sinense]